MIKKVFPLLFLLLLPTAVLAQSYTVGAVAIEGNHRVDANVIRGVISVKAGQTATPAEIDKDVRAIYALKHFKNVWASIDRRNGATILTYHVVERPLVRTIKFVGNKKLKPDKLKPLVTLKAPGIFDPQALDKSAEAIRNAYKDKGYYAASVEPKVEVNAQNEATVTFDIHEGEKALIDRIRFAGNTVFTAKQLRKAMQTKVRWFLSWLTDRGTYKEDVLQADLEGIADMYYNDGYVQVKVRQPQVTLTEDKEYLNILIGIEEGARFRVGTIDIEGDLIKPKKDLLGMIKLHSGDVFDRETLRKGVLAINDLYADKGYAYVNVTPLTHVDQVKRLVSLKLDIEQGILVHINQIKISGNTKTRDKIIRRQMKLTEGHLYSATGMKQSKAKIRNLGFFDEVNVNSAKGPDEGHMDVDVKVKEKPTGTFSVGAGYSSVDGIIGQTSVQQNNFLGKALQLNLSAALGAKTNTYQAGILNPYFLDTDLALGGDLYKTRHDYTDFSKRATGGDVKFGFPLTEKVQSFSIYRFEKDNISDVAAGSIYFNQQGNSTLSSFFTSLTRDTTDYRLDPTTGSVSQASVEVAGLGGTEKFLREVLDGRKFWPWKGGTVFSLHGQIGYVQKISDSPVPVDERFYLGGINSMRGFKSREVGPRRPDSVGGFEFVGGDKEAYFNLEYIFPLVKEANLKGVLFFDTGNAWAENEPFFSSMRNSVGMEIRWFSPMGPLRLAWGYNLNRKSYEPKSNFDFTIGSSF